MQLDLFVKYVYLFCFCFLICLFFSFSDFPAIGPYMTDELQLAQKSTAYNLFSSCYKYVLLYNY